MSFTEILERVIIENNKINIRTLLFLGKEGDYFVVISPSILVSGYGKTEPEALESFQHNLKVFGQDVLSLKIDERNSYLESLGFLNHHTNFSRSYVDSKGILQEFDAVEIKTQMIEAEI